MISKKMGVKLPSRLLESFGSKVNLMKVRVLWPVIMTTYLFTLFLVVDGDIAYWKAGG